MQAGLSQVAIFQELPPEGIARLAEQSRRRMVPRGGVLAQQGEEANCLYVIVAGRVRLERIHPALERPVRLGELVAGDVAGELGVLDGGPRPFTAVAVTETEVIEIPAEALALVILRYPEVTTSLLQTLSMGLHTITELASRYLPASEE